MDRFEQAMKRLLKPGVHLPRAKNVPLYRADDDDPSVIIRELNGVEERGTFRNGRFEPQ